MKNEALSLSLLRIERMEKYYDKVSAAMAAGGDGILCDPELRYMAKALDLYMKSGAWLQDYELDERGLIPEDMKRGVLSEDGLYCLLRELDEIRSAEK